MEIEREDEQFEIVSLGGEGLAGVRLTALVIDPEHDVAFVPLNLQDLTDAIGHLAGEFVNGLRTVRPDKATVEFSVTAGIEAGKLVAILGKPSASSTLKLTLEWNTASPPRP